MTRVLIALTMSEMRESLSIRSYRPVVRRHSHDFHQIIVPLHGAIEISFNGFAGAIPVGYCVIVPKGVEHSFQAQEPDHFLVADLLDFPLAESSEQNPFAMVSSALRSFCLFVDMQLQTQINKDLETSIISVFKQLLTMQDFVPEIDSRIARVLAHIEKDVSQSHSLDELAGIATLSVSQFKVLFKKQAGKSAAQFLLELRMEKARALLANSDMPITIVAEKVGYADPSAFARRFQHFHGRSPRDYKNK